MQFVQRKPDPQVAKAELRRNLTIFVCGIFGYYSYLVPRTRAEVLEILLTGLRRQEYRGYDSAGLAVDSAPLALEDALDAESRGGVAGAPGSAPVVVKGPGKIAHLEALVREEMAHGGHDPDTAFVVQSGIAHTRWATHGEPTAANAHPHSSGLGDEFLAVHNGIITNFRALRGFLEGHGERFVTDTDTEVVPRLCSYLYRTALAGGGPAPALDELVCQAMRMLEGAYGLIVKSRCHPGSLVACKRGSPLILGLRGSPGAAAVSSPAKGGGNALDGARSPSSSRSGSFRAGAGSVAATAPAPASANPGAWECFVASDAAAVVEHTKRVIVLEDNDLVHIHPGGYEILNAELEEGADGSAAPRAVPRSLQTLEMEVSQIMKGGYDHFMQKEIHEQPDTVLETMRGRVLFHKHGCGDGGGGAAANGAAPDISTPGVLPSRRVKLGGLADWLGGMRAGRRLVLVGCGTSYHACLAARPVLEELTGLPVCLELASDMLDRRCPLFRDDAVVFVSQSGETADTLQALEYARRAGALCIGLTNTVGSSIARASHAGVHINAGAEIGVASTKAYTSQIVALTMLALALGEDSLRLASRRDAIVNSLGALPGALRRVLRLDGALRALAAQLADRPSLLLFGRGHNYATALEGALKVKEVALMHSEGILAGEMKHGPLALVDESLPVVVLATRDGQHGKMLSVIAQLRARRATLIVVGCEGDAELLKSCAPDARGKPTILPCDGDSGGDDAVAHAASNDALPALTVILVPEVVDCLQPIVNIVPLQLLAYHLTLLRGHDVDQPRNLAKSVTVSEEDGSLNTGAKGAGGLGSGVPDVVHQIAAVRGNGNFASS